jgi:alpha-galactosidase
VAATLGIDPLMGWSSWSFIRQTPTEANIKAQAQALHDSGLASHGFIYVNIDDFYYLNPNTNVDANGRWVVDTGKFPNGMAGMASFVHGLGMKFGMYVTPGIPVAAVNKNTPIAGTQAHAADIAVTSKTEMNYNIPGSMYYIDYTKSGAQQFIDSWASLFASYGIDYLKIDGVGSFDIPDVQAWSTALKKTGRSIHLELSNTLAFANATTWASLSNGWRVSGDVECYCSNTSYPLTSWANASTRFALAAQWQPYSGPNARNDLDSLELGNGSNDGLTVDERQTVMSLWALAAAPLILGTDLTHLDSTDVSMLTNDEVIAVNQAGIAAKQVTAGNLQVWSTKEPDGTYALGLFNLGSSSASVTAQWSSLGLSGAATVRDLWAHTDRGTFSGSYAVTLASHASALLRIKP